MPPSVSLSPFKGFQIDLVNTLHHATILEIKLKQAEDWAKKINELDLLINTDGGDASTELDEDFELTVSDASAITKEKEDKLRDIQQFRTELGEILDCLQGHHETSLQGVLSEEDDESVQLYGQQLISWFESIRGHLIEILGRTSVILREREERKKKRKEESKFSREFLDQMATLQTYVMKTDGQLNDVVQRRKLTTSGKSKKTEQKPNLPDPMDVDDDPPSSLQTAIVAAEVLCPVSNLAEISTGSDFMALLDNTKTNLQEFRASRETYASKADSLHDKTTKVIHEAPPGHPIIPVRNVEINAIDLDPTIRQIVVEEFELLYSHFLSSLTEETGKREEEAITNLTKTMAEGNKLVCKLLSSCLGVDELEDARTGVQIVRQERNCISLN